MKYSDENLMRMIGMTSNMVRHGGRNEKESRGHGEEYWDKENKKADKKEYKKSAETDNDKVGYPNCPGPGCKNGCNYKGTEECPKFSEAREKHEEHDKHEGYDKHEWSEKHEGHDKHEWNEKHKGHDKHEWDDSHEGHGPHGDKHHKDEEHKNPMGRERVLMIIDREGTISQIKLANILGIRPQSVSELLGKLEGNGYIVRTHNDQDKREVLVSLTEEGKKRAGEVKDLQAKRTEQILAPLSDEERHTLFALLTKLAGGTVEE